MAVKKFWAPKAPGEIRTYGFNWTPRQLGSMRIISIDAEVTSGSAGVEGSSVGGEVPGARPGQGSMHTFTGGNLGETCKVLLTAVLEDGQVLEQTCYLPIRAK